jgi:hypothetical protein
VDLNKEMSRALLLIVIGMFSLSIVLDVVLLAIGVNGYVLALATVAVLSLGGIANYFAVGRYGERAQAERARSRRAARIQG